nr:MspA family porin [Haliangium sp. UPWRP_2]
MDDEQSLSDGKGRTLTIQQWDTFLDGVYPMDRNRLTREWFHSGRAVYSVSGSGADEFVGRLKLGYQVGVPASLGAGIQFSYTTPNIALDNVSIAAPDFDPLSSVIAPNLIPAIAMSSELGNTAGLQEVVTVSIDVGGRSGSVTLANAHGTVSGVSSGVLLRPFARLISQDGDSVTSYGQPWNMN